MITIDPASTKQCFLLYLRAIHERMDTLIPPDLLSDYIHATDQIEMDLEYVASIHGDARHRDEPLSFEEQCMVATYEGYLSKNRAIVSTSEALFIGVGFTRSELSIVRNWFTHYAEEFASHDSFNCDYCRPRSWSLGGRHD